MLTFGLQNLAKRLTVLFCRPKIVIFADFFEKADTALTVSDPGQMSVWSFAEEIGDLMSRVDTLTEGSTWYAALAFREENLQSAHSQTVLIAGVYPSRPSSFFAPRMDGCFCLGPVMCDVWVKIERRALLIYWGNKWQLGHRFETIHSPLVKRHIVLPFETDPFFFRRITLPLFGFEAFCHGFPFKSRFEQSALVRWPLKPALGEVWG